MTHAADNLGRFESLRALPALSRTWPPGDESLALEPALALAGHARLAERFGQALQSAAAQRKLLGRPVIAVLGELNAGKSSVVASFLSERGRQRLPRGLGDAEGTHRFVYWVPSSWLHDAAVRQAFLDLLAAAHGDQHEFLAEDPDAAKAQYRSGKDNVALLRCPLVAEDPALDALGAAFLDCPDVQTKDVDSAAPVNGSANLRLDFVGNAARICSAFLLVWEAGKIRDQLFGAFLSNLRERMASVPIYLLINKIEPNHGEPALTRNNPSLAQAVERFGISAEGCYGAFHFRMRSDGHPGDPGFTPGWNDLTPAALVELHRTEGQQIPQFFNILPDNAANAPDRVDEARFLKNLPQRLSSAALQRQKFADSTRELEQIVGKAAGELRAYVHRQRRQAAEVHAGLLDLCVGNFTDRATGQPLQVPTREFTAALKESFVRTSPVWVRWSMKLSQPFERGFHRAQEQLRVLRDVLQRRINWSISPQVKEQLADLGLASVGLDDPASLARRMRSQRWTPLTAAEDCLTQGWQAVLRDFHRFPLAQDEQRLDLMTDDFWRNIGFWQKARVAGLGVLTALGTVTAFAGLLVAAVDAGATSLTTFSLMTTLSAKIPGAAALAAAAVGGVGAFAGFVKGAVELNTLPYLSKFFALACDAFGVPRKLDDRPLQVPFGKRGELQFFLPEAGIPPQPAACAIDDLRQWREGPALAQFEETTPDDA